MSDKIYAKDCKCVDCEEQAVAFWPCMDPDIPSHPYCRACLDKIVLKVLVEVANAFKNKVKT